MSGERLRSQIVVRVEVLVFALELDAEARPLRYVHDRRPQVVVQIDPATLDRVEALLAVADAPAVDVFALEWAPSVDAFGAIDAPSYIVSEYRQRDPIRTGRKSN